MVEDFSTVNRNVETFSTSRYRANCSSGKNSSAWKLSNVSFTQLTQPCVALRETSPTALVQELHYALASPRRTPTGYPGSFTMSAFGKLSATRPGRPPFTPRNNQSALI